MQTYQWNFYFFVNNDLTFHVPADEVNKPYCIDNAQLIECVARQTADTVEWLRRDEDGHNQDVARNLPYTRRIGRILREAYWTIDARDKEWVLKDLTEEDIAILRKVVEQTETADKPIHSQMTANLFFECCKMGYVANDYFKGKDLPAVEMYRRSADGRHDGLLDIDPDSPQAFKTWKEERRSGGHPWEVCRGGNSNHISLFVDAENGGWRLRLAGSSSSRVSETVKFAVALYRNNIFFDLWEAREILAMVTGKDFVGIVPQGVMPRYCHAYFPREDRIIDFMNLPDEHKEEVIATAYWYPEDRIELA